MATYLVTGAAGFIASKVSESRPISPYAASKKAAEVLCHTYHSLHGLDVTIVRYFTVYGPAGRPDMSLFRWEPRVGYEEGIGKLVAWYRENEPWAREIQT